MACEGKFCEVEALRAQHTLVLQWVLAINAVMFVVEMTAGILAHSTSLVADSLDMLGDSLAYTFSLYVVAKSALWQARAAMFKGVFMAAFSLFVFAEATHKIMFPVTPVAETIGIIALLALSANSICLYLLWRHRTDNLNMHSVWLCSRNDIIANVSVLFAALGVWLTQHAWPDILVGLMIAVLFLRSAFQVIKQAITEMKTKV